MAKEKTIEVEITASKKVTYKQTVTMKVSEYEKIKDLSDDDVVEWIRIKGINRASMNPEFSIIDSYLNKREVFDSEDRYENVSIELVSDK